MSIFSKAKQPQRSFTERCDDLRKSIYAAMAEHNITGKNAVSVLDGILQNERLRASYAPLPALSPRRWVATGSGPVEAARGADVDSSPSRLARLLGRA